MRSRAPGTVLRASCFIWSTLHGIREVGLTDELSTKRPMMTSFDRRRPTYRTRLGLFAVVLNHDRSHTQRNIQLAFGITNVKGDHSRS